MLIPFGVFSAAGAGGGAAAPAFDLISTTILGSDTASVTFDVTGLGSTYKHLQIRATTRSSRSESNDPFSLRLNSDTGSNYAWHALQVDGGSPASNAASSQTYALTALTSGNSASANIFGGAVIDFLDPFSTAKYKTVRSISGVPVSGLTRVGIVSGLWMNTAATTSITLGGGGFTYNFKTGSRFSLYGIKG